MTANMSELEAAIAAGIGALEALIRECVSYRDVQGFSAHEEVYQLINGYRIDPKRPDASKAFAAYREQVAVLVAENARLRDALRPILATWAEWKSVDWFREAFDSTDFTAEMFEQAAAALADVEAASTSASH